MVATASEEVVVVWLGGKQFALPVGAVREVVQLVQPTAMPSWPEAVLGIIEIRGELLPLFDMSVFVGQSAVSISKNQFIVEIGRAHV